MKKIPQHLEDKLIEYLDGKLPVSEQKNLESLIHHDSDLQIRLEELRSVNTLMRKAGLDQPSKNFTSRVMSRLHQKPVHNSLSIRNGILLLAGVLVTIGIAIALISAGVFDNSATSINLNEIKLPKKYIDAPLPTIPFDGKVLVNVIIVLNLALVFVVLDRAILKPYFQRRMKTSH